MNNQLKVPQTKALTISTGTFMACSVVGQFMPFNSYKGRLTCPHTQLPVVNNSPPTLHSLGRVFTKYVCPDNSPVIDVSILGVQASAGRLMIFIDWHLLQNSRPG